MPDYMASLVIFGAILAIFLSTWSSVLSQQTGFEDQEKMYMTGKHTTNFLVSTPGYPEDWNSSTVQIPGFASSDNVLQEGKIDEFQGISYEKQRRLLQAPDFYLELRNSNNSQVIMSAGKLHSDASTVIPFERSVIFNATESWIGPQLFAPFNKEPGLEDVEYGYHFQIQEGSETIGNSFSSVEIKVETGSPDIFGGTGEEDLVRAGVDKDGDGDLDRNLTEDVDEWNIQDGGSKLKIGFGGSKYTDTEAGDEIVIQIENLSNPDSPGEYDVKSQTSGDGNWQSDTFIVGDAGSTSYSQRNAIMRLIVWK